MSFQSLPKSIGFEVDFFACRQTQVFYKFIVSLWVCIARHAQSIQNNKFAISLQYLKENLKNEFVFLHADNHQKFLEIDTIKLSVCGKPCPKINSAISFAIS